jgi:hypothetical protein
VAKGVRRDWGDNRITHNAQERTRGDGRADRSRLDLWCLNLRYKDLLLNVRATTDRLHRQHPLCKLQHTRTICMEYYIICIQHIVRVLNRILCTCCCTEATTLFYKGLGKTFRVKHTLPLTGKWKNPKTKTTSPGQQLAVPTRCWLK